VLADQYRGAASRCLLRKLEFISLFGDSAPDIIAIILWTSRGIVSYVRFLVGEYKAHHTPASRRGVRSEQFSRYSWPMPTPLSGNGRHTARAVPCQETNRQTALLSQSRRPGPQTTGPMSAPRNRSALCRYRTVCTCRPRRQDLPRDRRAPSGIAHGNWRQEAVR
jgi:hypothetical protein